MKPRLHYRFLFWNILLAGIAILFLDFVLSSALRGYLRVQIREDLHHETALVRDYLIRLAPVENEDDVADRLSELLGIRVTLIAADGRVMGESQLDGAALANMENHGRRPEVLEALKSGAGSAVRYSTTLGIDFMYVAQPYPGGIVRLAMPLTQVDQIIRGLRTRLYSASLIGLALILLFSYLVALRISRPIREIAQGAQQLATGNLDLRFSARGEDEIAALANSLDRMAGSLSAKVAELSAGKHRLEMILGAIGEGVMVLDREGTIQLVSGSIREVLQLTPANLGESFEPAVGVERLRDAIRGVLAGGPAAEGEFSTAAGRVHQFRVTPVSGGRGELQIVAVLHDLTEIRRTEQMRRDFVSNVSHEFKTPLTSICGYTETLLSGSVEDPVMRTDFLKVIERNARHLELLVRDLLILSKLEAELPAQKEAVDVQALVMEHLSTRQNTLQKRRIQVSVDCAPLTIQADKSRLTAAVSNLIDNAIHYNRPGGQLRITGALDERGHFVLNVTDTGYGIPEQEIQRIFERFYRIDRARSRDSGGTGLGLSIAKHAVESQGGRIRVTSRPGQGSTFTVIL